MPVDPVSLGLKGFGSLVGGFGSMYAANKNARAQDRAAQKGEQLYREGIATQKEYADKGIQKLDPYEQMGRGGLEDYVKGLDTQVQPGFKYTLGDFSFDKYTDPSTQYMMDQARKKTEASAFAKGGLGGGTLRALNTEIQNMANTGYNNAYNRYFDMEKFKNQLGTEDYSRNYTYGKDRLDNQFRLGQLGAGTAQNQAQIYSGVGKDTAAALQGIGAIQAGGTVGASQSQTEGVNAFLKNLLEGAGTAYDMYNERKK